MGLKSHRWIKICLSLFLTTTAVSLAQAGAKNGWIQVYDSAQLQQALTPANAGKKILVHAGEYEVSTTLVVPDRATVRGEGKMLYDDGLPEGFVAGSATVLQATLALKGNILEMGNGASLENVLVRDLDLGPGGLCAPSESQQCSADRQRCCTANRGNLVSVSSRFPQDSVAATISECELDNPNFSGIAPNGPSGRGVLVITRNLNLANNPPAETDSKLVATMIHSVYRAARGGSGVFAVNFAARSKIDILVVGNRLEGGIDANGGVSRPDAVDHSSTSIASVGNLFKPSVPGTIVGMQITGGSGAPIAFPLDIGSEYNRLDLISLRDRIEDAAVGILATGSRRYFGPEAHVGPSSHNQLNLQLYGTEFSNSDFSDLYLVGAGSAGNYSPGDFNSLRALIFGASGDDSPNNLYADTAYGPEDLPLPPENSGQGNALEILGTQRLFLLTNDGFDQSPPPPEVFGRI